METRDSKVLFDAGPSPKTLKENMERLKVDPMELDFVVISHEHGDHVGGLPYVAEVKPGLRVYVPSRMSPSTGDWIRRLGLEVVEVDDTTRVANGVMIVGQLGESISEQALAMNVEGKELVTLVGCSHPGVVKIVEKTRSDLGIKPYLVLGGFTWVGLSAETCRDIIERLLALGVEKIAPIHCSGDAIRDPLRKAYPGIILSAT